MEVETTVHYSKNNKQALHYAKTHDAAYRYLAYRDIPAIIKKYLQKGKALDFGSGAGRSARFLHELGFTVSGVDINKEMLQQAQLQCPTIPFYPIENGIVPFEDSSFDLIFSSFVLVEISSKQEMIGYLAEAKRVMKKDALFVGIADSKDLHDISKKWLDFDTNFPENENLVSGKLVKLYHYDSHIEFADYYWTEEDYRDCFAIAGLNLIEVKFPLGNKDEGYHWRDELVSSPFNIFVATVK